MGPCRRKRMELEAVVTFAVAMLIFVKVQGADPAQLVTNLPGMPEVSFQQYAGYVMTNATNGRNLFYWFFTADHENASSLPLAVWLNGGPGCSSVGDGLLSELGPFIPVRGADGKTVLSLNHNSWIKEANIIFLESPIDVGFSYSDNSSDYDAFTDKKTAEDNIQFLLAWFEKFPEYKNNDFYLAGESYAGHYIPTLAREIVKYNEGVGPNHFHFNFIGFTIGNPWTDAYFNNLGATDFWHSHSLISDESYEGIIANCDFARDLPVVAGDPNQACLIATASTSDDLNRIDIYNIFTPSCNENLSQTNATLRRREKEKQLGALRAGSSEDPCAPGLITPYLNSPEVKKALHVKTDIHWAGCSDDVFLRYSSSDIVESMLPIYDEMMNKGLKIWIYSGDTDAVCPTTAARYALKAMNLTIEIPWYPWNESTQVGGYTQVYKGLIYTTVRDSGHFVPLNQPERALSLFRHFLAGIPLPAFAPSGS